MSGVLVIDTASDVMVVAFVRDNGEVEKRVHTEDREHTQMLLRLVDEVTGGDREQIKAIAVVRGPGGYAGIRIGIATAQGLGLATGAPVLGIDTLRAVAETARLRGATGSVTAVHPAGRGDFAAADFIDGEPAGEPWLASPEELAGRNVAGEETEPFDGLTINAEERLDGVIAAYRKGAVMPAEAAYIREPHITLPRKAFNRQGPDNRPAS